MHKHNIKALKALPDTDSFPWIHRKMFHSQNPTNIEGTYRKQVILFGASYKSVEYDWPEWLEKFENILRQLFWTSATIHLKTELVGNHTYEWDIPIDQIFNLDAEHPMPITSWEFKGGPRDFLL